MINDDAAWNRRGMVPSLDIWIVLEPKRLCCEETGCHEKCRGGGAYANRNGN